MGKSVSFFYIFAWFVMALLGCSSGDIGGSHDFNTSSPGSKAIRDNIASFGDQFCISRSDDESWNELIIAPHYDVVDELDAADADNLSDDLACDTRSLQEGLSLEIDHDQPIVVLFKNGRGGEEYCLVAERSSGYVTISHEVGTVHRTGNVFTWCFIYAQASETILIRSITPHAHVTLTME